MIFFLFAFCPGEEKVYGIYLCLKWRWLQKTRPSFFPAGAQTDLKKWKNRVPKSEPGDAKKKKEQRYIYL
jgi:hypothetical protein